MLVLTWVIHRSRNPYKICVTTWFLHCAMVCHCIYFRPAGLWQSAVVSPAQHHNYLPQVFTGNEFRFLRQELMHLCLTYLQFLRARGEVCQKESPMTSCYQKGKKPKTTSRWGGVGRVCSAQDCISSFIRKNGNKVRINQRSEKKTYHQVATLFHNRVLGNILDFHTVS